LLKTRHLLYLLSCAISPINCAAADEIKVYTELLPPYQFSVDGNITGIATQNVIRILDAAKLSHQIIMVPWARAYELVQTDKNSLIYSMNRTPEREDQFHWLAVVASIEISFVAAKDKAIKVSSLNNVKSYITAVVRGGYAYHYLTTHGFTEGENLLLVSSIDEQINLLIHNKIDLLFTDIEIVQNKLLQLGLRADLVEAVLRDPSWHRDLYLASAKSAPASFVEKIKQLSAVKD
jgi:polar amino acid transport system substrate-binding protein